MASQNNQQQQLFRRLLAVWAVAASILLAAGVFSGISYLSQKNNYDQQVEQAAHMSSFWSLVAGVETSDSPTPDVKLAYDLKAVLGPIGAGKQQLPPEVHAFRGNINTYGGAAKRLGVSFFQSGDSGAIKPVFKTKLLLIKQGEVGAVVASEQPAELGSFQLPWGLAPLTTALIAWLLGGPVLLFVAHRSLLASRQGYRMKPFLQLSWQLDGVSNGAKMGTIALAPTAMVPIALIQRFADKGNTTEVSRRKHRILDQAALLTNLSSQSRSTTVQNLVVQIGNEIRTLMARIEERSPVSLLSSTGNILANLDRVETIIKQYLDVEQNPQYHDNPKAQLEQYERGLAAFEQQLFKSIRLLEGAENVTVDVAVKQLQAAEYRTIA